MAIEDVCYEIVDGEDLQQGDIIKRCPMFIPDYPANLIEQLSKVVVGEYYEISGEWQGYNVVVLSHSCDLENGKLKFVAVCPYWSVEEFSKMSKDLQSPKALIQALEEIRRGYRPSYHMLDECDLDELKQGIQIIDFRSVYSIPYDFLKRFVGIQGRRLRLHSPYKEELSQAFGKFFMRVARPKNISSFRK